MQTMSPRTRPEPGELWEFPLGTDGIYGWVVVRTDPEGDPDAEARWLVVPADAETYVGPTDVAIPLVREEGAKPVRLVLRGALGRWVRAGDFWFKMSRGAVAPAWCAELVARLASPAPSPALPDGAARDFETRVLAPAAARLEAWVARKRASLVLDLTGEPDPRELDADAELMLAAAGSDALDAVAESVAECESDAHEVVRELAGVFEGSSAHLRVTPDEVQLEVNGSTPPPACLFLGPDGQRTHLRWVRHIGGGWRSQPARLDELAAPPLRLVVAGEVVLDLELDFERLTGERD